MIDNIEHIIGDNIHCNYKPTEYIKWKYFEIFHYWKYSTFTYHRRGGGGAAVSTYNKEDCSKGNNLLRTIPGAVEWGAVPFG